MNKQISTPIGILVILLFSVVVVFLTLQHTPQISENNISFDEIEDKSGISGIEDNLYERMQSVSNWSDIEKEIELSIDELRGMTATKEEEEYLIVDGIEDEGLSIKEVKINYDNNDIFSVSLLFNFYGAYPVSYEKNYAFLFPTGDIIKIEELVKEEELVNLASVVEKAIKENVASKREYVESNFNDELEWFDEKTKEIAVDAQETLSNFKITEDGITFYYDFEFPHAAKEIEPQGSAQILFRELDGLLQEIAFSLIE